MVHWKTGNCKPATVNGYDRDYILGLFGKRERDAKKKYLLFVSKGIGRLLITLYLVSHGLLSKPSLYLSAHLEKQRGAYYDALTRVRESNDIGHWCRFFLQGVSETAENGKRTFQSILNLRQDLESQIVTLGRRAENGRRLISHLYEHPAVSVHQVMEFLGIQFNPARNLIAALADIGILKEITGQRRNRIFLFEPYFNIFADSESETWKSIFHISNLKVK